MASDLRNRAEGIWQFQKSVTIEDDMGKQANDVITFVYHNDGTVTLRLVTFHLGRWKSSDDFYRLSAKWEDSTLFYLPPFGDWTELAVFEDDDHFVNVGNGKKRIFEKIGADQVIEWNRAILKEDRELHDYRIQPDGSVRE